jgi:hypothetical protein
MKNIVLFTTRPITSKYTKSLIEQMSILKEYQDMGYGIIFVSPKSSQKNIDYIEEVAGIKIDKFISYKDHYAEVVFKKKYKTWNEYIENVSLFEDLENIEHIVCFGGILSDATGLTRNRNHIGKIFNSWNQMNFTANGTYLTGLFQLIKLSRERSIPFHEICFDPCENSIAQFDDFQPYKYNCYHGYDWPEYSLERLDSLQHYLLTQPKKSILFKNEKEIDLCFGFTALTRAREAEYDLIMNGLDRIENLNVKLYVRHKGLNIDTFVNRDIYLDSIQKSKYTLIIPPYDKKHFSVYRFIESIDNDCLPLIIEDTYIVDFVKSFGLENEKVKQIITSYDRIGESVSIMKEEKRLELLSYFKEKCLVEERKLHIGEANGE